MTPKRKPKTPRQKATADRKKKDRKALEDAQYLWRQITFERAKRCCEICGKGPFEKGDFRLQAHHLVKRSQSRRLLLDPQNGAALCPGCHLSADRDPIRCLALIGEREQGLVEYLLAERRVLKPRLLEDDMARLKEVAGMYGIDAGTS